MGLQNPRSPEPKNNVRGKKPTRGVGPAYHQCPAAVPEHSSDRAALLPPSALQIGNDAARSVIRSARVCEYKSMPQPDARGMNPVSPKLTTARYFGRLPWVIVPAIVFVVCAVVWSSWFYIPAAVFAALFVWLLWLIPAQVKLLGWQETPDELLITKGRVWHTFTVVPYGRIQYVDVTHGVIERSLGMKTVTLNTASATSDATVEGLPAEEADALRERLTVKARERMSGL